MTRKNDDQNGGKVTELHPVHHEVPFADSALAMKAVGIQATEAQDRAWREATRDRALYPEHRKAITATLTKMEVTDWDESAGEVIGAILTGKATVSMVKSPIVRADGIDFIFAGGRTMVYLPTISPDAIGVARPAESMTELGMGINSLRDFAVKRAEDLAAPKVESEDMERTITLAQGRLIGTLEDVIAEAVAAEEFKNGQ